MILYFFYAIKDASCLPWKITIFMSCKFNYNFATDSKCGAFVTHYWGSYARLDNILPAVRTTLALGWKDWVRENINQSQLSSDDVM